MNCKSEGCENVLFAQSKSDYCPACRKAIQRERAERIAEVNRCYWLATDESPTQQRIRLQRCNVPHAIRTRSRKVTIG